MLRSPVTDPRAIRPLSMPGGGLVHPHQASLDQLIEGGLLFCGTPDTVYQQIVRFTDGIGGLGHLLLMMQGGDLSHEDTGDNLTLFAREVMPRLKERYGAKQMFQAA